MRENRSFILLLFVSLILLFGWQYFLNWMYPPPKPVAKVKLTPPQFRDAVRAAAGAVLPDVPPMGNALHLATTLLLAQRAEPAKLAQDHFDQVRKKRIEQVAIKKPAVHRTFPLGDETTNLKAELTTFGAGVQSVELKWFKGADRHGRRIDAPLQLIPGVDEKGLKLPPSFLLFHYEHGPDDPHARPWETLGKLDWAVQEPIKTAKNAAGDAYNTEVTFTAEVPGQNVIVSKTYTLEPETYHLGLSVRLHLKDKAAGSAQFRYQLAGGHGLPIEGQWYTSTYRTAMIGQTNDQNRPWRDYQESRTISIEQGGKRVQREADRRIRYAAVAVQYFASVIVVDNQQTHQDFLQSARPTLPWTGYVTQTELPQLDDITVRVNTRQFEVRADAPVEHKYLLYHGPLKVALLEHGFGESKPVDAALVARYKDELRLDTLTDYKFPTTPEFFTSIGWTYLLIKCTNMMHVILGVLHSYLYLPYGVGIMALTVLVRLAMFPISRKQALMSVRMQALAPGMKELQEKYKDDPKAKQQAVMELYRKHGVNPLGSCWVMFLQMPIFMGLYYALQESVHFRLAGFLWMDNLAAPDMLFPWGESIPFISRPSDLGGFFYLGPYFNLLPIIAIALMVVQQKLFTPPPADEQQEMQMKMMKYMMIFMGILFYKVAAGLALYFIISSAWGLAERRMLPKAATPGDAKTEPATPAKPAAPAKGKARADKSKKERNGVLSKMHDWWEQVLREAKKK